MGHLELGIIVFSTQTYVILFLNSLIISLEIQIYERVIMLYIAKQSTIVFYLYIFMSQIKTGNYI